jgi:hypothetical protein
MLLRLTTLARKRGVLSPAWQPDIAARALQSAMSGLLFEWMRLEKSFDLVAAGTMTMTAIVDSLRKKDIRARRLLSEQRNYWLHRRYSPMVLCWFPR